MTNTTIAMKGTPIAHHDGIGKSQERCIYITETKGTPIAHHDGIGKSQERCIYINN